MLLELNDRENTVFETIVENKTKYLIISSGVWDNVRDGIERERERAGKRLSGEEELLRAIMWHN